MVGHGAQYGLDRQVMTILKGLLALYSGAAPVGIQGNIYGTEDQARISHIQASTMISVLALWSLFLLEGTRPSEGMSFQTSPPVFSIQ